MALTTGDFAYYYGLVQPAITGLTTAIGGGIDTGNPVVFSNTGIMPTGQSNLAGAGTDVYYAKMFVQHEGVSGETLTNAQLYISNQNVSNQVKIALDPYYTGYHTAATGQSDNRITLPDGLSASDFQEYRGDNPMSLDVLATGLTPITIDSGDSIGFWVQVSIPAGLSTAYTNTFDLVLRGEV